MEKHTTNLNKNSYRPAVVPLQLLPFALNATNGTSKAEVCSAPLTSAILKMWNSALEKHKSHLLFFHGCRVCLVKTKLFSKRFLNWCWHGWMSSSLFQKWTLRRSAARPRHSGNTGSDPAVGAANLTVTSNKSLIINTLRPHLSHFTEAGS